MESFVKQEPLEPVEFTAHATPPSSNPSNALPVIDLSTSSSDSDSDDDDLDGPDSAYKRSRVSDGEEGGPYKKQKFDDLPLGFLDPLPSDEDLPLLEAEPISRAPPAVAQACKQFWKAGDYEGDPVKETKSISAGMDHVRVHPRFLHSNATSHKWALGAFAELLDNSLDEVCNGATYVNLDMLENNKDGSKMLLIEDNGGGMGPDKMRQCMSLGYSAKSKLANTIGQYGNGFKTSTMRLGADVIVFSRCRGKDGKRPTQSIGMLSYTFLRSTRKEDIVVPMIDYEKEGKAWRKLIRSSLDDWNRNAETIIQWSPYLSIEDLLLQFSSMNDQGTRIVIYNLWEDDQRELELDFGADRYDIQLRGVNRDEKKIQMAAQFPNSRHFLTYRHSLRSYAAILYLKLPSRFRIILRGKDVEHHNTVNDMMLVQEVTYRPQPGGDGVPKDTNMVAVVKIGFVKDARDHIDVQGFNVYHKNRLIKPFWRLWNAAGSDGRGVIGVLEANFVEPAHDKQGFERTLVLQRLETRLIQMQKTYWSTNCHKIGYAPRRSKKLIDGYSAKETSPERLPQQSSRKARDDTSSRSVAPLSIRSQDTVQLPDTDKSQSRWIYKRYKRSDGKGVNGHVSSGAENGKATSKFGKRITVSPPSRVPKRLLPEEDASDYEIHHLAHDTLANGSSVHNASAAQKSSQKDSSNAPGPSPSYSDSIEKGHQDASKGGTDGIATGTAHLKPVDAQCNGSGTDRGSSIASHMRQLEEENHELKERLCKLEESMSVELQFERDRAKTLEAQMREWERKLEEANREQEALIDIFSEERNRRDKEEENLRKKLKDATITIQELIEKAASNNTTKIKQEQ
ncbi:protein MICRORCHIDIA 7-like [Magnolia sinica]|uniref:protein MICRORCHIDIA 7-like n=1 Tax=Magnolia sinica TaxID=86752 RepID=UPI00265835A1|nr:protein MICRORCHIDIA 7-like [Magnolia sinica]